jgi:hypothetical protein
LSVKVVPPARGRESVASKLLEIHVSSHPPADPVLLLRAANKRNVGGDPGKTMSDPAAM